jgi:hypothetical protein
VVEEDDPVGERVGLVEVVGGQDDGAPAPEQRADDRPERAPRRRRGRGRLVEHEQVGVAHERDRQVQPLLLAARELAVGAVRDLAEAD